MSYIATIQCKRIEMWIIHAVLITIGAALPADGYDAPSHEVPGVVEPIRQITVQSSIDGRLAAIKVNEGQLVQEGDLLVQLDDDLARAEVRLAEVAAKQTGKLLFADAELDRAEQAVARLEKVNNHHAIAARELEEARSNLAKAIGNVKVASDELESLRMDLERAKLRLREYSVVAPFAGIVTKIRISRGQVIQRQNVLMNLVDTSKLRVEIAVPIARMAEMEVGNIYHLPVDSIPQYEVLGKLTAIDPVLNSGTNTIRCVFEIDNSDRLLPAGFLAYPPKPSTEEANSS